MTGWGVYVRFFGYSALADGAGGADASTGTAVDAGISVNLVVGVALGDRANGALALAAAAADALVTDYIGHYQYTS
jgi:hypothetical protein